MAKQPKDTKTNQTGGAGSAEKPPGKLKQIRLIAGLVHKRSPKSIPIAFAVGFGVLALFVAVIILTGSPWYWYPMAVATAFLVGFYMFSRSAQRVQYSLLEGHLGGGGMILENMRGNWSVSLGVNANRTMDVVHRVVGRPGVLLVGEGDPQRLKPLLAAEKKRVARVAHQAPIYEFQVGTHEEQVPVSKIQRRIFKLPRNLNKAEIAELNYRLKALPPPMQMPKGPMPKGAKTPKMPTPKSQGGGRGD